MKKTIISIIGAFIGGIILTICSFHAYTVYQVKQVTAQNNQAISQIVDFINKNLVNASATTTKQ